MGNSPSIDSNTDVGSVHPHVHGELHVFRAVKRQLFGSSPRAWGTRNRPHGAGVIRRFIPTCMGNSPSCGRRNPLTTVHPHVHGELRASSNWEYYITGSSPRAWGTPCCSENVYSEHRFIPTCMGNSSSVRPYWASSSVHPHVHGELGRYVRGRLYFFGSSPRAWGTLSTSATSPVDCRFIPTCMGNSGTVIIIYMLIAVHPHVHGELIITDIRIGQSCGSSPRAWGTRIPQ